jgi:hypothetical protein
MSTTMTTRSMTTLKKKMSKNFDEIIRFGKIWRKKMDDLEDNYHKEFEYGPWWQYTELHYFENYREQISCMIFDDLIRYELVESPFLSLGHPCTSRFVSWDEGARGEGVSELETNQDGAPKLPTVYNRIEMGEWEDWEWKGENGSERPDFDWTSV